ncbi:DUF2500 domain-containing protein [uncultured Oscillibacter sp.]|jgi:hypothetical protein|uniref:DUF2500 domain-containing protein n=1 Tax=uncultured Oscillibacter sp. TaxID=876091 RepID=UPI0026257735|nr:DUF2500 domain-containing protein [uncultured Oscillibacter sp.]
MSMGFGMGGFDLMFSIFPFLFITVFVIVIGTFVVMAVRGVGTWSKNNASPRLTVSAQVVTKRTQVSHHHHQDSMSHTSTAYFATFQVESGDRMEFSVSGAEYGMLAEGDQGSLTFQGTRYLGFERS